MNVYHQLREETLPFLQGRLTTITAVWEAGAERVEQRELMQLEAHRLISGARQVQLVALAEAARTLEQRLKTDTSTPARPREAHALIAESLYALQAAVAQAVADHERAAAQRDPVPAEGETLTEERPLAGLRVLLVEDSGDLATSFQQGLRLVGCERVACCGTIAAAKALLAPGQPPFDIVLIDHNLVRERGTALATWMRQQPHLARTQRVSYSAMPRERIVGKSAEGDFHHILELRGLRQLIGDLAALRASLR